MMMRAYLELKDGSFLGTMELLQQPDRWKDLKAGDRRLIRRYAARLCARQFRVGVKGKGENPPEKSREYLAVEYLPISR